MHKACSSQLLLLSTDIEETLETLSVVQVETSLKEQCLLMTWKKSIVMFSCKTNLQFLSSIDVL
jgi:hypothetical protein